MPTCCAHEVTTPFCPHCGKKLREDPRAGLRANIYTLWKNTADAVASMEEKGPSKAREGDRIDRVKIYKTNLLKTQTRLAKYKSWLDWIDAQD